MVDLTGEIGGSFAAFPEHFRNILLRRLVVVLDHRDGDLEPPGVDLVVSQRPLYRQRIRSTRGGCTARCRDAVYSSLIGKSGFLPPQAVLGVEHQFLELIGQIRRRSHGEDHCQEG